MSHQSTRACQSTRTYLACETSEIVCFLHQKCYPSKIFQGSASPDPHLQSIFKVQSRLATPLRGSCKRDDRSFGRPAKEKLDDWKSVFRSIWRVWSLFAGWINALGWPPDRCPQFTFLTVVGFSRTHSVHHLNPHWNCVSAIFRWSLLSGGHRDRFDRLPFDRLVAILSVYPLYSIFTLSVYGTHLWSFSIFMHALSLLRSDTHSFNLIITSFLSRRTFLVV